jgi:hypothetical protein
MTTRLARGQHTELDPHARAEMRRATAPWTRSGRMMKASAAKRTPEKRVPSRSTCLNSIPLPQTMHGGGKVSLNGQTS